ncbi:ABC transporter permease subunit [Microbacterium sp. YY-01]|uniref:ABC transporter permease subunit n=1 Tax=Microbacterium sp. YY-01 TaxID=3421634 RepID=UPI003D183B9E
MMTTTTVTESSAPLRATTRNSQPGRGVTLGGLVRSEFIKIFSLRSIRWVLAASLATGIGLGFLLALMWSREMLESDAASRTSEELQQYLMMATTVSLPFLALIFGILGVLVISNEYSSGLIQSTLVSAPRRGSVFVAKGLVLIAVTLVTAVLIVAAALIASLIFAPDAAAELVSARVVSGLVGMIGYLTLLTLFAYGCAALLRSTAAAIGIVVGVVFVAPIVLSMLLMTSWEWVPTIAPYFPTDLGNTLSVGVSSLADLSTEGPSGVSYLTAVIAMVVWAVATVVPALFVFKRRDA